MRAHSLAVVVAAALVMSTVLGWAQGWDAGDVWLAEDARNTPLPSWFGSTGLVVVPTAQTLGLKGIQANVNVVDLDDEWQTVASINAGLYEGLEVGVTSLDEAYAGGDREVVVQAKYRLPTELFFGPDEGLPMVAIGGRDLGDQVNRAWYLVLTTQVPLNPGATKRADLTIGVGDTEVSDSPLEGVFAGVDLELFDYMRLNIEHDGENLNAALRYFWSEWAVTEAGLLDDDLGFGFSYNTRF
ncbi:MAG: hypothetical protein AB7Y46_02475 [Armatimonadota bacterium]